MITLYANRALGLLSAFLRENEHVTNWLLPANICFSVPLTFLSRGRTIDFYDFDILSNTVHAALSKYNSKYTGVLLVNHYGLPHDDDSTSAIKQSTSLLIVDACLSVPNLKPPLDSKADLTLFSTGKGKVVELGFGAFGHLTKSLEVREEFSRFGEWKSSAYNDLETYWKGVINGTKFDHNTVLTKDWIDEGRQLISSEHDYMHTVNNSIEHILSHKSTINEIYRTEIDPDFHWNPSGNLWRFNLLVDNSKLVMSEIFSKGLFASQHYANTARYIRNIKTLKNADLVENHMINLFNSQNITHSFAQQCAEIIRDLIHQGKLKPVELFSP